MKIYFLLLLLVTLVYTFTLDGLPGKPYRRLKNFHSYNENGGGRRGYDRRRGGRLSELEENQDEEDDDNFKNTRFSTDNRMEDTVSETGTLMGCKTDAECAAVTTNSVCKGIIPQGRKRATFSMCMCPNHLICITLASLGEDCNASSECAAATPNSVCDPLSLTCACDEGYVISGSECLKTAALGETCDTDAQCQLTGPESACDDTLGRCVCVEPLLLVSGACVYCPLGMFYCHQNSTCISQYLVCDGSNDCQDGMDEVMCDTCTTSEFVCMSGGCADRNAVCNGTSECSDGSDELTNACPIQKTNVTVISDVY